MSYIVPKPMPEACDRCPFCCTKWYHPFWSASDKAGTKGYYCSFDSEHKILELPLEDKTTKAQWCPLIEWRADNG